MFIRVIMKFAGIEIRTNFPRDVSAVVTGMDTLHQVSHKRTRTSQMSCLNNNKKNKKNLPVLYGKADFNVSVEVTAKKLAENLKKTLSEIYVYDKSCLYIMIYFNMPRTEPKA